MATEVEVQKENNPENGISEETKEVQEKTITSFTEDQKLKLEGSITESKETNDPLKENGENVKASETPIVDDEKISEVKEENDSETKAENVTSTESGQKDMEQKDEKIGISKEEKEEDEAQKKIDDGLGSTVAKHYNEIPAGTKELRKESRIFHLRNFNNWVKSVIINEYLEKVKRRKRTSDVVNVLDLACGKGGDLLKWQKGKVDHVIMADIADTSIDQCKERYAKLSKEHRHSRDRLFTIETFAADCTKVLLKDKYNKPDIKLDMTSCQFAFHYSFESYEQADMMLRNACENLQEGGYFIGTTPDANKLVKCIKACKADSFGNSVFNIKPDDKEKFPIFGGKYMFYLEGVVACPEFIVHLPALEKLAEKYNMKLVWKKNFHDLFKQYERQYSSLLQRMNALEQYPAPSGKTLTGGSESQYKTAKDYIDQKEGKHTRVSTLSADEWEVAGLYLAFVFEKLSPPRAGRSSERDSRKRQRDDRSRESNKSRDGSRQHEKRKSSDTAAASAKKSRKDVETDDVYEIKDEIYDDEADKMENDVSKPAADDGSKTEDQNQQKEDSSSDTARIEGPVDPPSEVVGTEVADGEIDQSVEVAQEAKEEESTE